MANVLSPIVAGQSPTPGYPGEPSHEDRDREVKIALARTALKFGQTTYVRRKAMREIEELKAKRSPAMLAWLKQHPEQA